MGMTLYGASIIITEDTIVNVFGTKNEYGFLWDVVTGELTVKGTLNGIAFVFDNENDNAYCYKVYGDAIAGKDITNAFADDPEAEGITFELVIPEGTSLTVPEGYIINLDSFDSVAIDGELIVDGTLICTHKGGTAICADKAVCDVCRQPYGETLNHTFSMYEEVKAPECGKAGKKVAYCDNDCGETDENEIPALEHIDDGYYICDHGCVHEFEKPVDPTPDVPDTPDEPADDTCDQICHSNNWFIKNIIWKIVQFFWKLFKMNPVCECGVAHY